MFPPELRIKEYPDCMQKKKKPMYKSPITFNIRFKVAGFKNHLDDAHRLRQEYNFKLNTLILNQYGVRSEAEVITGHILKFYRRQAKATRKFKIRQQIAQAVQNLRVCVLGLGFLLSTIRNHLWGFGEFSVVY